MGGSSKTRQTSTQTEQVPDWIQNPGIEIFNAARSRFLDQPFKAYDQPRVAQPGQDFTAARNALNGMMTNSTPFADMQSVLGQIMAQDSPNKTVADYMNPYVENALQPTLRKIRDQATTARNDIAAGATMAGAFGDSRHGVADALNRRDEAQLSADVTAQGMDRAFTQASGERNTAMQRLMQAVSGMGGIQQMEDAREGGILQRLLGMDNYTRGIDQAGLDANYSEFLRGEQQPMQNLTGLMNLLRSQPYTRTSTGVQIGTQPNTGGWGILGSLLGSGMSGGGGAGGGGLMSSIGSGLSSLFALSDERAKTDVTYISTLPNGQKLYSYRYKDGGPVVIGFMAQEVAERDPSAVGILPGGWLGVDYSKATETA